MPRIKFMNIKVDNLTMEEALGAIEDLIGKKKNAYIVTPNVDHIVRIERSRELRQIYEKADLVLTDGKPLLWISKWYGTPIKEKISGSDLFPELCRRSAVRGYKMFFLGAGEGVAARAAANLQARFPGLQVSGAFSPPFGFEKDEKEIDNIIAMVKEARPQILIVGLGCPKQERFMYEYGDRLEVPVSLGLGASFDFEAGRIKRAPVWMRNCGLEWFYRLTQDPKRLFRRYIIDDTRILGLAWKYRKAAGRQEVEKSENRN